MKSFANIIITISLIALYSCSEMDIRVADSNKAVVEAYLIPGHDISIIVSKQLEYGSSDTVVQPIEDLSIILSDGITQLQLTYSDSVYTYANSYNILTDSSYTIDFIYNNCEISAETYIPPKPEGFTSSALSVSLESFSFGIPPPEPEPIELEWDNLDNGYFMVVAECIEENPEPVYDTSSFRPPMVFRNTPIQSNYYSLNTRSFSYFGTHYLILYRLNPEYAELYEDNGSSTLNLEEPPGNIENGLGIFTGLNADTILFEVIKSAY